MAKKPVKKRAPKKSKAVTKPYEPTEREQAAIDAVKAREESSSPAPMIKVGPDKKTKQIHPDHPLPGLYWPGIFFIHIPQNYPKDCNVYGKITVREGR